jgi:hypothetical protein
MTNTKIIVACIGVAIAGATETGTTVAAASSQCDASSGRYGCYPSEDFCNGGVETKCLDNTHCSESWHKSHPDQSPCVRNREVLVGQLAAALGSYWSKFWAYRETTAGWQRDDFVLLS